MYVYVCMYSKMNITISIPQETEVKLQEVSNKSALITQLLNEHFDGEASPKMLKLKRQELQDMLKHKIKAIDYKIEVQEKEVERVKVESKKAKVHDKEMLDNIINSAKQVFDVKLSKEQAQEYRKGKFPTLAEYIKTLK